METYGFYVGTLPSHIESSTLFAVVSGVHRTRPTPKVKRRKCFLSFGESYGKSYGKCRLFCTFSVTIKIVHVNSVRTNIECLTLFEDSG